MKSIAFTPPAAITAAARPGPSTVPTDAFRRLLDREQMAALARFRAVPGGARVPSPGAGDADVGKRGAGRNALAPQAPASRVALALPEHACAVPDWSGAAPTADIAAAISTRPAQPLDATTIAAPRIEAPGPVTPHGAAPEPVLAALRATCVDASQPWPLRKLHCRIEDDGVHVWLRDGAQRSGDAQLEAGIAALRQALQEAGYRLAGFTLNGIRLI
jgi:hypothetical protein